MSTDLGEIRLWARLAQAMPAHTWPRLRGAAWLMAGGYTVRELVNLENTGTLEARLSSELLMGLCELCAELGREQVELLEPQTLSKGQGLVLRTLVGLVALIAETQPLRVGLVELSDDAIGVVLGNEYLACFRVRTTDAPPADSLDATRLLGRWLGSLVLAAVNVLTLAQVQTVQIAIAEAEAEAERTLAARAHARIAVPAEA